MTLEYDADVLVEKFSNFDEAIGTIETVTERLEDDSLESWIADDLYALHLQRAIQAAIDIANHLVASNGWRTPDNTSESFEILAEHNVVSREFVDTLTSMVGFRNIAVHSYGKLDPQIVRDIAETRLDDLREFSKRILQQTVRADE